MPMYTRAAAVSMKFPAGCIERVQNESLRNGQATDVESAETQLLEEAESVLRTLQQIKNVYEGKRDRLTYSAQEKLHADAKQTLP